jgi:hypothetical protein
MSAAKLNLLTAAVLAAVSLAWPGSGKAQSIASTAGLESPQWTLFSDPLGTRVDYPENIFPVDAGPAPRGMGRTLRSRDDRAWLMVYVEDNEEHHTPASFVRAFLTAPRDRVDYNRITDRFFAISGVNEDQTYYSRCNFPAGIRGRAHCIYLAYPKDEERRWDAIVTRISRSLRPSG